MNRKLVTTGLLAGLVAGGGAGLILQQTGLAGAAGVAAIAVDDSTTTDSTTTDSETDSETDVPAIRPERGDRLRQVLQPLIDDGTLTTAQLESVVSALESAGPLGGHGPDGRGGRGHGRHLVALESAASALRITTADLRSQLIDGSTIAEVAAAQGVDVQAVIDALVADAAARLAERVTAGELTQDEANARVADLTARITELVNNGRPGRRDRPAAPADSGEAGS